MVAEERGLPRDDADNDPSPAVRLLANAVADEEGEEDADSAGRHVHQGRLHRGIAKSLDQGGGVGSNDTTGDGELARVDG